MKYILMLAMLALTGCFETECKDQIISKVGGCNKDGVCGVIYHDDSRGREHLPVEGQVVRNCYMK